MNNTTYDIIIMILLCATLIIGILTQPRKQKPVYLKDKFKKKAIIYCPLDKCIFPINEYEHTNTRLNSRSTLLVYANLDNIFIER